MIVPMKLITLLCLEQDKSAALEQLGELALMQLCAKQAPATQDITRLTADVNAAEKLTGAVKSAPKQKEIPALSVPADQLIPYGLNLLEIRSSAIKESDRLLRERDLLLPWGEFDHAAIKQLAQQGVYVTLCATARAVFDRRVKRGLMPENASVEVIHRGKDLVHYALISLEPLSDAELDTVTLPDIPLSELNARIAALQEQIQKANNEITAFRQYLPQLEADLATAREKLEFATARDGMDKDGHIVYLSGYVPCSKLDAIKSAAMKNGWALLIEDPAEDDPNVPTCIEKPRFLNMLDPLFDFIGIAPGYRESDVSLFFFLFFPIFFGMIIGDAGYGLLMIVIGVLLRCLLRRKEGAKLPLNLLIYLAMFSFLWGWLNGAWFGLPKTILPGWMSGWDFFVSPKTSRFAHKFIAFYGVNPEEMTDNDWASMPNKMTQYFCFLLAMIHLVSAHLTRFISGIRRSWREIANLGWAGMIVANFVLAVSLIVFPGTFPAWGKYLYIASIALIFITLTPIQLFSLPTDLVGSFVDVLSYVRLFAVGLSGMYIAEKFNEMGTMVLHALPDKLMALGFVMLVLIAIAGHLLNFGLGFLGVLVHAIRLNTLEFSNHMGIQWAGTKFKPFTAKQHNN